MSENLWNYTNYIDSIDVKKDKIADSFAENQIKNKAREYVESRIQDWINKENLDQLLKEIKQLLERQDIERVDLITELKQKEVSETKENIDKEALIQEAKTMLYEKLWINENQNKNWKFENFLKWIVDELVIGNYELAIEIYNTNGKIIIESLKQLASWEWIKKVAQWLWESIWNLFDGNAYEKWKSTAQLWLLTTWVWLWVAVWKKWIKLWMKEITRFKTPKEAIVTSPEVKWLLKETGRQVNEIVPKKQVDFSKMLVKDISKLWDKERLEAWSFYLKWKKFTPEQEKAIIKAHEVWKDRAWAWIYNYNHVEISQKSRILKEAWFSLEERRLLMEKWVCGKESLEQLSDWSKKIDRQHLQEDIPREDIILREVKDFQEIPPDKASLIDTKLVEVINTIPYNSFEKLEKLLQEFDRQRFINPNTTLLDAFNKMDFSKLNRLEWSNCVWMSSFLQQDLLEQWIKSHLVRFDAWPMLNPEYVVNGHAALVIPRILQSEKHFTLADPWLLIPKSITFAEWKRSAPITIWNSTYIVAMDGKNWLPYVMDISSFQRNKKLYFDPNHEWMNPNTTLNKDIMRSIWDFKIVKWDKYFKTDLEKSTISLWYEWKKITISYEDFQKMKNFDGITQVLTESGVKAINNGVLYNEVYAKIVEYLWKKPDTFFDTNNKIIQMSGDYKNQIWAPSTRNKISSN